MIVTPTRTMRDLAPPANDKRLAEWAAKYYGAGLHRKPEHHQKKEPQPCNRKP